MIQVGVKAAWKLKLRLLDHTEQASNIGEHYPCQHHVGELRLTATQNLKPKKTLNLGSLVEPSVVHFLCTHGPVGCVLAG